MKLRTIGALNPMGSRPAVRHGDVVVTECAAICAYLADTFPEAKLAPPNSQRGSYYRRLFAAGPLEAAVSNRSLGFDVPDERRRMIGYGSFADVMDTLEIAVSTNPFVAGHAFTAADVYVGSHVSWGLQFGSTKRPAFEDYLPASAIGRPSASQGEGRRGDARHGTGKLNHGGRSPLLPA